MIRNIGKYFLFFFFFVFTLSLVNISPLFAKKEKEADKTAVDTDVCKRDTTKTGAEQYSAKCKEQCTSTDEKFAKFKEDNKDACDLLQALSAPTDNPAITKEQQEIESLVQNVVDKLNKIETTDENTAALEAIIPEFPSPTSKEFTITFSDKLRTVLEAIIFPQSAPEPPTATIALYNVLNETTTTPATDEKKPATAEKTPIQVRAEAAIKTIILKSFDPLTDATTGKYHQEVIQELRDHWLNVDLKGDATTKDTPFTVDNFKSAIFGSIGYSLPHELYHFEFDEALTKAIKDHAEADTAKKAFVEAYKKYIETNTKIEIQSDTWKEGQPLQFKISLNAGDALVDPGIKCTDEKSAQFQKDNAEVCKLVAVAANQEVCKKNADITKTGIDQYSEPCKTQCTSTDEKFTQFKADNAEVCKLVAAAGTNRKLNTEACKAKDISKSGADQYSDPCKTQCILKDLKFAQFQEDNKEACKLVADAVKADTATAETEATKAETERVKAVNHRKTAEVKSNEALKAKDIGAINTALDAATLAAANAYDAANASRKAANAAIAAAKRIPVTARAAATTFAINANTSATEAANVARDARGIFTRAYISINLKAAEDNRILAENYRDDAKKTRDPATAKTAADKSKEAADKSEEAAVSLEALAKVLPNDTTVKAAAVKARADAETAKTAADAAETAAKAAVSVVPQTAETAKTERGNAEREKTTAVSKSTEAKNATTSTDALPFAKLSKEAADRADTAATNAEAARDRIPTTDTNRAAADTAANEARGFANAARTAANEAAVAVINKAQTEAQGTPGNAQNAQTSTLALGFAQTAAQAATNAEAALLLIPVGATNREATAQTVTNLRTAANEAALAVIDKALTEAQGTPGNAQNAQTSTLALGFAQTAAQAATNAEAARDLIPATDPARTAANTNAGDVRSFANEAAEAVITKAKDEAEAEKVKAKAERDKAKDTGTSTLALGFAKDADTAAKKADTAADEADEALKLVPSTAATAARKATKAARTAADQARDASNEAAEYVISKAETELRNARKNAKNADNSTDALVEAEDADRSADNAEEALLLIPKGTAGRYKAAQSNAKAARKVSNEAAQAVIAKAKGEAVAYAQTADTEHTNVTNAAGNRATALAAAGRARTAADNAAASAKNAEAARDLIPATDPARAIANTDAGHARTSATNADGSADAAEAAVPPLPGQGPQQGGAGGNQGGGNQGGVGN